MSGVRLERRDLLAAVRDPALDAINFLNEIIDRYPDAISFAPGAPFGGFIENIDVSRYIERYIDYLGKAQGLNAAQIRRRLYQYGPSRGIINGLLAEALRIDEDITVAPESIVVTVGAQEAMVLALRTLCPGPDSVLAVTDPCFAGLTGAAKVLGIETAAIAESDAGIDFAAIEVACRHARAHGKRIKAMYVAPDYSNPTGMLLDLQGRRRLLELAAREDFLILEDNTYRFTAAHGGTLPSLKALDRQERVLYIGTCAKNCMPGLRVGYVVADQKVVDEQGKMRLLADELSLVKSMVTVNTSPLCQAAVGGLLLEHGGSLSAIGREKAAFYRRNLAHLLDALERHVPLRMREARGISWNRPGGGFFVRMTLPVPADFALVHQSAREFGVLWTPMRNFYQDGGNREIRLSCSYLTEDEIDEGTRRLSGFLESLPFGEAGLVPQQR